MRLSTISSTIAGCLLPWKAQHCSYPPFASKWVSVSTSQMKKKSLLITGATGYLGQFLVQRLADVHKVGIIYHSTQAPQLEGDVHEFWADISTGEGLQEAFDEMGPVDAVINCAANSSPAACEKFPEQARAVNVPVRLIETLEIHKLEHDAETLLIHLSTDNVYQGSQPYYSEDSPCEPVNCYGVTKRDAEVLIQERWENHVILRSSIIFGPQPPSPVSRLLFLQFIVRTLKAGKPTKFFSDEFRSPVYVWDVVEVIFAVISQDSLPSRRIFNVGGPQRMSRSTMAETVAQVWGYSTDAIEVAETTSVKRENPSPKDISMDITRLCAEFPSIRMRTMSESLLDMRQEPL